MDLRDVFAANLRRLRHAKGLSQDDLAYEARISRSNLSQIEKGAFLDFTAIAQLIRHEPFRFKIAISE